MGFKQFKDNLGAPKKQEKFDVSYTEVDSLSADMFTDDQFFYFEILGDNYHVENIIGFAWEMTRRFMRQPILTFSRTICSKQR